MSKTGSSRKVDEVLFEIMDRSYEKLQFQKWCEKFVEKYNSLSPLNKMTVEQCMVDPLVKGAFAKDTFKFRPEAAAEAINFLVDAFDLCCAELRHSELLKKNDR